MLLLLKPTKRSSTARNAAEGLRTSLDHLFGLQTEGQSQRSEDAHSNEVWGG